MPDAINTAVPISCSPEIADALAPEFIIGHGTDGAPIMDPAFSAARGAFVRASADAELLAQAATDIKRAGMNDPATRQRLELAAAKRLASAGRAVTDAIDALGQRADAIQVEIADKCIGIGPTRLDFAENARAGEVRAYLRSLPEGQRAEAARKAIVNAKDRSVAAAILGASPLASGLSADAAEGIRLESERIFAGPQVARRDAMRKLQSLVVTAGGALEKRFGGLVGVGESPAARVARSLGKLEQVEQGGA